MARRRYLSTEISVDEAVNDLAAECGDFASLLYTWMIPHAEDDGIIRASLRKLQSLVVPMRRDKTEDDIRVALVGMVRFGLLEWDEDAGLIIFPEAAFYRYQTYIKPERRRAAQPTQDSAVPEESEPTPQNAADQRTTPQNTASFNPSLSPSSSVRESSVSHETGADAPQPVPISRSRGKPAKPKPDKPPQDNRCWPLWESACELVDVDAAKHPGKGKQMGVIDDLLRNYDPPDLLGCFRWLLTDGWERQRGVDFVRVGQRIDSYISAGRPDPAATHDHYADDDRQIAERGYALHVGRY